MPEHKIIVSGFGGQGVVLAGTLLAQAALNSGKKVVGMVSYGAEIRGGTANSSTTISDDEIASPVIENPDAVIALNQPSFDKYKVKVRQGGYMVVNTSLVKEISGITGVNLVKIPASEIASNVGNIKTANVVAVGSLIKNMKILPIESVVSAIEEIFKSNRQLIDINKKALMEGVDSG